MEKLSFAKLSIEDKHKIDKYLQADGVMMSDRCFASLFIWGEHYKLETCIVSDTLIIRSGDEESEYSYYMPLGDIKAGIESIERDSAGKPYKMHLVTQQGKEQIQSLFPEKYSFEEQRGDFDYIYSAQSMITLAGKKLHSKRNHINKFEQTYAGRWQYSDVDPIGDYDEIMEFLYDWCHKREGEDCGDYRFEYSAIERALKYAEPLGIEGGAIRIDGKMIAMTLGAPQNDQVMDILIEKANGEIQGAYQIISKMFAQKHCEGFEFINREEDMGKEGLRKAKESYYPVSLTEKYTAVPLK